MTKIDFRCTEAFKESVKIHAKAKNVKVTTWIKDAIIEKMKKEEK